MKGESSTILTTPRRSLVVLFVGLTLIIGVQGFWSAAAPATPSTQVRTATMGLFPGLAQQFAPFYYQAGQIPVVGPSMNFTSADGAAEYARLNGSALKMDADLWSREGDLGRIWLYAPWAWMGSTGPPSVLLANALIWTAAVAAFFVACWWIRRPVLGGAAAALLSVSPFYLHAVHGEENIFWLPGAVFLLVAALSMPIAHGRVRVRWALVASGLAGVLVGLAGSMRREVWPIALVAAAAPWLAQGRFRNRVLLSSLPILMMVSTDLAQKQYFDRKWTDAVDFVSDHGGEPVTGQRMSGHTFWHPVWCGLGDFGSDKGYNWRDSVAYGYGFGEIERRFGVKVTWTSSVRLDEKDPPGSSYTRMAGGYPHYEDVLREKVVSDIKSDPVWYARILLLRFNRMLAISTPFNGIGYVALIVLGWRLFSRRWRDVWLMVGSLTVSIPALTVYSGNGATWSGLFGIVGVAVAFDAIAQKLAVSPGRQLAGSVPEAAPQ